MSLTLLLDLDDTLLDTNLESFLPAYYEAISHYMAEVAEPATFVSALKSGVRLMMLNRDTSRTLQQVFEADFYPRLGIGADTSRQRIMRFYREEFPALCDTTRRKDGASELVEWARSQGYHLALATDPLFPQVATLERVRWAGLDPEDFDLISSFESFHFSKSHPAFFAEMLGRLGWPEGPVLMAGNDVQRDLLPANQLGLATYHVVAGGRSAAEPSGDLRQLRAWIQSHEKEIPPPAFSTRQAILEVLEATPAAIQGMTAGLSDDDWAYEQNPDEWAIIELICHLRDTEREVHALQIETLLASDDPFVARPDAAYWAKQRRYLAEDGQKALREFAAARAACLDRLRAVPEETWARAARHAIFGPTSFLEVVGFMAEHDRLHLQQAFRTLQSRRAAHPN